MRRSGRGLVVALAVVGGCALAGCGSGRSSVEATAPAQRYQVDATVLDAGTGPELCAGGVMTSNPPQCSGPPVAGWDWATIDHDSVGGVQWGEFGLVGTWDGTTFTVLEPPTAPSPSGSSGGGDDFSPPCPAPEGGWPAAATTLEQYEAFMAAAQAPSDFAAIWTDARTRPADPGRDVYTVAYTGDLDAHRAALEAIWPGPLCVVEFPRTLRELQSIQGELGDRAQAGDLGVYVLSSGIDELHGRVAVDVLVADPAIVSEIDARYGAGVVELRPRFRPVP